MIQVTYENFKEYLNKPVEVEITFYWAGIMYPDENILIGMNPNTFYFYSKSHDLYWDQEIPEDPTDKNSTNIEVFYED